MTIQYTLLLTLEKDFGPIAKFHLDGMEPLMQTLVRTQIISMSLKNKTRCRFDVHAANVLENTTVHIYLFLKKYRE